MAVTKRGEMQDNNGDVFYPHTESNIVFCADGETVQEKLANTEKVLGESTGTTGSLEINDANKLVTSDATYQLDQKFGGVEQFIVDGETGKITGYKTKVGADTVFPFSSIKEQTVTKSITLGDSQYSTHTFVFDELEEVKGVLQITKQGTTTYGKCQTITTLGATSGKTDNNGSLFSIEGNVLEFTIYNSVNQNSTAEWTVTAVGI